MTHFPADPRWNDAVLGQSMPLPDWAARSTDAVLGSSERLPPSDQGDRHSPRALSLQQVIQQSLFSRDPYPAIFCQLSPRLTFQREAVAMSAPRNSAYGVSTSHRMVSLLWGFYGADLRSYDTSEPIWYNLFYFKPAPLRCFLSSVQAGFGYEQLERSAIVEWEYHFETAFGRCGIGPERYQVMAHMAQFYPETYALAWAAWQAEHQVNLAFSRQIPIEPVAIDAVIELANYYLWFQMKL
jgi:hypothetical protein